MMTADIMGTYPTKEPAAAREQFAQPVHSVANELPYELSRLPEQYGFNDVNSFVQGYKSAANGGGRKKNGRPQAAAVPKIRKRAVIATIGFTDDSHPTILAAIRG